jgi:DNA polymerase-1
MTTHNPPIDTLVVDGTNLLHRCHHAMESSDLRNADGDPMWAINGLLGYSAKLLRTWRPRRAVIGFDLDGCPTRKTLAPDYKAGRKPTAPALATQLAAAPDIIRAFGFSVGSVSGWEADDICATVATKARGTVAVVTADKDAHQLICDRVIVVKPEGTIYRDTNLIAKYGVPGRRWVEYAALVGEASDNLHGVDGIGPKRAADLINAYDDIEDALNNPADVTERLGRVVGEALPRGADAFRRNRQVATLRTDLTLGVPGTLPTPDMVKYGGERYNLPVVAGKLAVTLNFLNA